MIAQQPSQRQANSIHKYLQCPQCEKLLKQPTRLHRCGHTFCNVCCPPVNGSCPCCATTIEARQPDLIARYMISDLQGDIPETNIQSNFFNNNGIELNNSQKNQLLSNSDVFSMQNNQNTSPQRQIVISSPKIVQKIKKPARKRQSKQSEETFIDCIEVEEQVQIEQVVSNNSSISSSKNEQYQTLRIMMQLAKKKRSSEHKVIDID